MAIPGKHKHIDESKFDQKQLAMGIKVEMEHTDDPKVAREIAKDHLAELPDYYTRLVRMEHQGEKELKKSEGERGGRLIGHTGRGNPIYASHDSAKQFMDRTKNWLEGDHQAAADKHKEAARLAWEENPRENTDKMQHHSKMAEAHTTMKRAWQFGHKMGPHLVEKYFKNGYEMSKALPGKMGTDEGAHRRPPKEYREEGATERSDYADPQNYKYPLHSAENVRAAISYFSKPKNAGVYSTSEQRVIWGRIKRAATKYNIELGDQSGPPSVEKSMSGTDILGDWLVKAKYTRREGGPGHWKYYYADTEKTGTAPGEVMGETASGKKIVDHRDENAHKFHHDFTATDHDDAMKVAEAAQKRALALDDNVRAMRHSEQKHYHKLQAHALRNPITNRSVVTKMSDTELEHQIGEATKELRKLDRNSPAYDAASSDLKDMFDERRSRKGTMNKAESESADSTDWLIKAQGEGTRGGHIIGHTSSGKPIYGQTKKSFKVQTKGWTVKDHLEAAEAHKQFSRADHAPMAHKNLHAGKVQDHLDAARGQGEFPDEQQVGFGRHKWEPLDPKKAKHFSAADHSGAAIAHRNMGNEHMHDTEKYRGARNEPAQKQFEHHQSESDRHYNAAVAHDSAMSGKMQKSEDTMDNGTDILKDYLIKADLLVDGQQLAPGAPANGGDLQGTAKGPAKSDSDSEEPNPEKSKKDDLEAQGQSLVAGAPAQGGAQLLAKSEDQLISEMLEKAESLDDPSLFQAHISHQLGQTARGYEQLEKARRDVDDVVPEIEPEQAQPVEDPLAKSWTRQTEAGSPFVYTNRADLEACELLKSDSFYANGGPIRALEAAPIDRVVRCGCGALYKGIYTACPTCGNGAVQHPLSGGQDLQKGMKFEQLDTDDVKIG